MSNKKKNEELTYKKISELGQGAYGTAYLVQDKKYKQYYVMKTIPLKKLNEKERKDALKEASILQNLDHPNIIKFQEVFLCKNPNSLNIITEYADGGDLNKKIERKIPFKEDLILDWFIQICLALNHVHSKRIIHRDIKAQNIFLTKNGIVKLGDFGISKSLTCSFELARTVIGTPYYLSPEIVKNSPYSFKTDVWSLGVLLYQMCALKMPFDADSLPNLSKKILKAEYKDIPNNYSDNLKNLIRSLLQVEPKNRPTVKEILSKIFFNIIIYFYSYI
jgi:NIMA (never in mitosis gene a)-related kinase